MDRKKEKEKRLECENECKYKWEKEGIRKTGENEEILKPIDKSIN